jgi:hypothetical protein
MPSPEEQFRHAYYDSLAALERVQLQNQVDKAGVSRSDSPADLVLLDKFDELVGTVVESVKREVAEPEAILKGCMNALEKVEEFRFLLDNVIESVKRDQSLHNTLKQYQEAGLVQHKALCDMTDEVRNSPWPWNRDAGPFLRKLWHRLRKVALIVIEIVVNAIQVVPKFASLKLKPSIGIAGAFPTFHLQFELEAEAVTIHELFHDLFDSVMS